MADANSFTEFGGHTDKVNRVAALPDGDLFVTACQDKKVRVFSSRTGECRGTLEGHDNIVRGLAALGGPIVASGEWGIGSSEIRLWNAETMESLSSVRPGGNVCAMVAISNSQFVAGVGGDLVFYRHHKGTNILEDRRIREAHNYIIYDIDVQGDLLASASWDRSAALWNMKDMSHVATLRGHTEIVRSVSIVSGIVATGSDDHSVRLYDANSHQLLNTIDNIHERPVMQVKLLDENTVLSTARDGAIVVTDIQEGKTTSKIEMPFQVLDVSMWTDGRMLAVGGDVECKYGGLVRMVQVPVEMLDVVSTSPSAVEYQSQEVHSAVDEFRGSPRALYGSEMDALVESSSVSTSVDTPDAHMSNMGVGKGVPSRRGIPDDMYVKIDYRAALDKLDVESLESLRKLGKSPRMISAMTRCELAAVLAAHMVQYSESLEEEFQDVRRCLSGVFQENHIGGNTIVGVGAMKSPEFVDLVSNGLDQDEKCASSVGRRATISTFVSQLEIPASNALSLKSGVDTVS